MTKKPLVSVIINCYNGEKYLREAIDSVMVQTYDNWELVFWDNQSTDSTREIVESYKSDKIRYYYAPTHTPLGEARNLAVEKAEGEYISFLDADDLIEKGFLMACINVLIQDQTIGLVYSRYSNFNESESWLSRGFRKDGIVDIDKLISNYNIGMSAAMFRKNIIENFQILFDARYSLIEDYNFFIRIATVARVYYLIQPMMRYRHHGEQSSKSDKWAYELGLMVDSISKDSNYSLLKPYLKRVSNLQGYYNITNALECNYRLKGLKLICKQSINDIGTLRYLIPLFLGKDSYLKLRKVFDSVRLI